MNIEARIQEILMKSTPVNDNNFALKDDCSLNDKNPLNCINIKGNNNIVIKLDWMLLSAFIWLIFTAISRH